MKKIIKYVLVSFLALSLSGCVSLKSPVDKTKNLLDKYIKNDRSIVSELNSYMKKQDLTSKEKERYAKIIKREYSKIKYEIKDEKIEDDKATVEVDIKVLDLYGASEKAEKKLLDSPMDFYTDGQYDKSKYIDYKLSEMENCDEYKDYKIIITLHKKDNTWQIDELDDETLEKIHGIYNYNKIDK